jgi:hypothetical protein
LAASAATLQQAEEAQVPCGGLRPVLVVWAEYAYNAFCNTSFSFAQKKLLTFQKLQK